MNFPWYMDASNLWLMVTFLYVNGFILSSLFFHKLLTEHKRKMGKSLPLTSKQSCIWFIFSVLWILVGVYALCVLIKSTVKGE